MVNEQRKDEHGTDEQSTEVAKPAVEYLHSAELPELLRSLGISLAVTTYQAQRVFTFAAGNNDRLSMLMRIFERPTGLAVGGGRIALGTKRQLWVFESSSEIYDDEGTRLHADLTFTPRSSHVTGDVAIHEIAFIGDEIHFVNTRFSCISRVPSKWSFEEVWRPKFITELVAEDRCHLNGFAIAGGKIQFVSALGRTNEAGGWRENKAHGGALIHYESGEVMAAELSMPHSPRIYGGRAWVLESGVGELQLLDPASAVRQTVCRLPGYPRGLAFYGQYAFVGLSKIREKNMFGGLKIETLFPELQCGVMVVDLQRGIVVGAITFTRGIEEIFDVQILPGIREPHIVGFEEETVDGLFILPPDRLP